ncbi:MAG: Abi family protein [Cetobacterium sp.]|uniref:Abi family protein n=1 Tax=Cetobacterium sp. TaxID=2071632 RepID=UPI003F3BAAC1
MDKPFSDFEKQIDILTKRGITCDDYTKFYLMRNNYYSVINFYKTPFLQEKGSDKYKVGVHIREIISLFEFDKSLRMAFFNSITEFERVMKTLISYHFSEINTNNKHERVVNRYLDYDCYYLNSYNLDNIHIIVKRMKNLLKDYKIEVLKHYKEKNNIPLWVLIHFLTFGEMSIFFTVIKNTVKDRVINSVKAIYEKEYGSEIRVSKEFMESFLKVAGNFRNVCAHNERTYNLKTKVTISSNEFINSKSRQNLFGVYQGLRIFLTKAEYSILTSSLIKSCEELEKNLRVIEINQILEAMGFPINWHKMENL